MKLRSFMKSGLLGFVSIPFFAIASYLMILLIFDSLDSLTKNFFSEEFIFIAILSYLAYLGLKIEEFVFLRISKYFPSSSLKVISQMILSILVVIAIVRTGVSIYFESFLHYTNYQSESLAIHSIFFIGVLLYNMIYQSFTYLRLENEQKIHQEDQKMQNLRIEWTAYKNEINPQFLFSCLETLISSMYSKKGNSDLILEKISEVYRYTLKNRETELVSIQEELDTIEPVVFLLNQRNNYDLKIKIDFDTSYMDRYLVPGTLHHVLEIITKGTIITKDFPLILTFINDSDDYLVIKCRLNERLIENTAPNGKLIDLNKAYSYYTNKPLIYVKADDEQFVKIPLLSKENELEPG